MATHTAPPGNQLSILWLWGLVSQWHAWNDRPSDVPSHPNLTYANEGWVSWPDWLGYGEGKPKRGTSL